MGKIMVTGALGNVGGYVVQELIDMGEQVVCADISIEKLNARYQSITENVLFDFTDKSTYDKALNGVDRVFLMRPPHLGKPEDLYAFIDKMKEVGIALVSFLSLMGVESNTIPPHHKIEKYIEKIGLPFAHIRPGFFMQNISGVHSVEIREQDSIFIPAGKSLTSLIDAADVGLSVATLLHNAYKYRNTAHTITGPQALNYYQVAEILSKVIGRDIRYARPNYFQYRNYYIRKRGLDKGYVNVTTALYFMTQMGTAKDVTDGFYKLTGKQPRSFEDFARANKAAFMR